MFNGPIRIKEKELKRHLAMCDPMSSDYKSFVKVLERGLAFRKESLTPRYYVSINEDGNEFIFVTSKEFEIGKAN